MEEAEARRGLRRWLECPRWTASDLRSSGQARNPDTDHQPQHSLELMSVVGDQFQPLAARMGREVRVANAPAGVQPVNCAPPRQTPVQPEMAHCRAAR